MTHTDESAPEIMPLLAGETTPPNLYTAALRVGYVPGAMPGKWFTRWHERYGDKNSLAEIALAENVGLGALSADLPVKTGRSGPEKPAEKLVQLAIMRPEVGSLDKERYHSIHLYDEVPVVILPRDNALTVLDEVPFAEMAEEFSLHPVGEFPAWDEASAPWRAKNPRLLPQITTDKEAIELVAAGVGLYIAPMSIARLYHRKDLTYRPVPEAPKYPVYLVWPRNNTAHETDPAGREETLIQDFIGIVRGRSALSTRGSETAQVRRQQRQSQKPKNRKTPAGASRGRRGSGRRIQNAKHHPGRKR